MTAPGKELITVVSGLPRSGTSLMMKMLAAGGLELLTDDLRPADANNPKGYFEFAGAKRLKEDQSWLGQAGGKAVKIISVLLPFLPDRYRYRVVFMERDLAEVIDSQRRMLARQGQNPAAADEVLTDHYRRHLEKIRPWLAAQPQISTCYLSFNRLLAEPQKELAAVARFFDNQLQVEEMLPVIDPALYRSRRS